ncbi:hypothetical protein GGI42DRAFT_321836 [Trichoderma sp. SZMC 28013]
MVSVAILHWLNIGHPQVINPEAAIMYAYYCDLCDYSTNIKGSPTEHLRSKARLAKEAEARRNANGNAEVNVNTKANGSAEAADMFKYSWNLCEYSTNNKSNFVSHSKSKAHLAKEAKARRKATSTPVLTQSPLLCIIDTITVCVTI